MSNSPYNLIVILGPTASGKTSLAVRLARDLNTEIISADSRQVYRRMDLGTGKDLEEFILDGVAVPYHIIDIVEPDYEFNVFEYQQLFYCYFEKLCERGLFPVMVGGTGLYIEAAIEQYQMQKVPENHTLRNELRNKSLEELKARLLFLKPRLHNTTDFVDRTRLLRAIEIADYEKFYDISQESYRKQKIAPFVVGISVDRELLRQKIRQRLRKRFEMGMIDEVKNLHQWGISWEKLDSFGLEYRYIGKYLKQELSYTDMVETLYTKICQFSKRQMSWFRRMERKGICIRWIEGDNYKILRDLVDEHVIKQRDK